MILRLDPGGLVTCVYSEAIDLAFGLAVHSPGQPCRAG